MNTRPYTDLLELVEALCGATLADQERVRIRRFVNRRAQRAYAATELWPRFLVVGEERIVSEGGLLSYEQAGLDDIGTVLRLHATQPFLSDPAREYGEFYAAASGIQITGYQAATRSIGADLSVTGTVNIPEGTYYNRGLSGGKNEYSTAESGGFSPPGGYLQWNGTQWTFTYDFGGSSVVAFSNEDVATPDLVLAWTGLSGFGIFTIEPVTRFSIYVTYKAALTATYGNNDGDTSGFPEEWFEYAAHGAYADFLRNEGQQEKALVAEAEATEILQEQLEKVSRQGGARVATRVMNHANHQSR
jgi:hypothetical protein